MNPNSVKICCTPSDYYYKQKLIFYIHLINDVCGL